MEDREPSKIAKICRVCRGSIWKFLFIFPFFSYFLSFNFPLFFIFVFIFRIESEDFVNLSRRISICILIEEFSGIAREHDVRMWGNFGSLMLVFWWGP
jgi:hypothetical protein